MKITLSKFVTPGVALAILVLLANAWISISNTLQIRDREAGVQTTFAQLGQLEALQASASDALTAQRGYLLTGDNHYLPPFKSGRDRCAVAMAALKDLTAGPESDARLATLRDEIGREFAALDEGIAERQASGVTPAEQAAVLLKAKDAVDALRRTIDEARASEQTRKAEQTRAARASIHRALETLGVATAIAGALVVLVYALIRRETAIRLRGAREQNRLSNYNRLLVDSTGEGIYGVDLDGYCTFINAAGAKLLGVKSASVLSKNMHDIAHHTRADGSPYPAGECPIYRAARAGQGCRVDDEVFWRSDGTSFPVEYSAYPIRNEGAVEGVVVTFSDITGRKQIEEEVRESGERFRTLADNIAQLAWMADGHGAIFWYNQRWYDYTGTTPEQMRGWGWKQVHHPDHVERVVSEYSRRIELGEPWEDTFPLRGKDGEYCWFLSRAVPIKNAAGRVVRYFGTNTDVTEQRRAAEALRASEEQLIEANHRAESAREQAEAANVAKSQFLANMSHELRTPLNAVIMYSELLQEEAEDQGVRQFIPDLDKIRAGGKHLLALVNGVLDLSKIEAGKMELYLETFDAPKMVRDVAATVAPLIQKNSNTLEMAFTGDVGPMYADMTKVRQVLFNLLSNASKFTDHGVIKVETALVAVGGESRVEIRVSDTGIGMTPAQLEKLFEPFTQADASTTRRFGGTGLGLAISKRFCEMMGGTIVAHSEPGKGSSFVASLPTRVARPAAAKPSEPAGAAGELAARSGAPAVLVIDDEQAVRDLITRTFADEGVRAVAAADGEEGLELARQIHPIVILLDVLMPKLDGWAVLTRLKADPATHDIPVVMLTITSDKEMGYLLGASDYLTKPVDRDRLAGVLGRYQPRGSAGVVLVVEDDAPTRDVLRRSLEKHGWRVVEAETGKVALDRLQAQAPGLILLDLMMPEMDGFEFLSELRLHEAWQAIPVVVLTSKDLTPGERAALSGKVERILQKGAYSRDALLREVRKIAAECARRPENCRAVLEAATADGSTEEARVVPTPVANGALVEGEPAAQAGKLDPPSAQNSQAG